MIDQRIGNYRVIRKLGEGGMGVVFECVHEYIGRRAAVKVLHADFSRNPEMAVRFLNEARATNIVQHPGIVNIFEFDRLPDGSAYIVMDFLDGDSLTQRMAKVGRFDIGYALHTAWQVSEALSAAHAKGVIHRDLKPDNIMIVVDAGDPQKEQAKILDFGIAKVAESQGLGPAIVKTQIGVPMGTPLYMAPEQWKGASEVDDRADVYSLGVILYEMLAGQPPFIANSSSEVMALHILAAPRNLKEVNPATPDEVAAVVQQMLAKTPGERPAMLQVARMLRRMVGVNVEISLSGQRVGPSGTSLPGDPSGINSLRTGSGSSGVVPIGSMLNNQVSTSQIGPLRMSGIPAGASGTSGVSQLPTRPPGQLASAQPGVVLAGSPEYQQPGAETQPVPPQAPAAPKWQRPALFGLIGLCILALGALVFKITRPPPQVPKKQQSFEAGGMVWAEVSSGTTQNLNDVWGSDPNNVWAVGKSGTLLRWNGASWSVQPGINKELFLNAVWGADPSNVWAVGKSGIILRWNGVTWAEVPSGSSQPLKEIWGTSAKDVWTVGEQGVILHWNGNDWSPVPSSTETELRGIWGSGPNDIWAVGGSDASEGFILHYDGTKWQPHYKAETRLNAVWGSAADDVWAVGGRFGPEGTVVHWDGKEWRPIPLPRAPWLNSIWGSGSRDIWVVGDSGWVLHYNGTAWAEAVSATQATFKSVYGTGPNDVWSVGIGGLVRHWNGKTWVQMPQVTQQSLEQVFGTSQNDVWSVGKLGTIVHWDGNSWAVTPSGTTNDLHSVTGSGFGNIWACGDKGTIVHWDGKAWQSVVAGVTHNLNAMFAIAPNDMWAVGDKGAILHYDGANWAPTANQNEFNLMAVFALDSKDVWAAGEQGVILHWDGRAWLRVQTDASITKPILAMYGSSPNDIWAVGKQGLLLNWNGRQWVAVQSGTTEDLHGMYGNGRFDVWAIGGGGVIVHWNGTTWTKILSPVKKSLHGLWSSRPGDLWVVGQFGLILH